MEKERNLDIDIAKAICMILVILGHCIQYGSGTEFLSSGAFFQNPVFKFIYSFHMPLFMVLSGYLFSLSSQKFLCQNQHSRVVLKKITQLLVPLLCWSIAILPLSICKAFIGSTKESINCFWIFEKILTGFFSGPWFLWAIWWCSVIVIVNHRLFKDSVIIYILLFLISFVLPDANQLANYKYMYPFFISGYLFNKYHCKETWRKLYQNKWIILLTISLFILLLFFYDINIYIYVSGYSILGKNMLHQIYFDLFRFLIGYLGSISILYTIHLLTHKLMSKFFLNLTAYIGANTMGIYLISGILISEGLSRITSSLHFNYFIITIETVLIMLVSLLVNMLLRKYKILNLLFLGGR